VPSGFLERGYFALTLAPLSGDEDYVDAGVFYDFDEAMEAAEKLSEENSDKGVYVSEAALFKVGRAMKDETIMFWWNKPYADIMEVVPKGRGYGYYTPTRGTPGFIEYEPDPTWQEQAGEQDGSNDEEVEEDEVEYAKDHCESCGKIVPLYALQNFTTSEEVGRSSGSSRVGRSSSRRTSGTRSSFTTGSSSSNSSGRTYYRTVTTRLCSDCYKSASNDYWIWLLLKWGFYAVVGAAVFYFANKR
jgi:hypothetical protein